MHSSMTLRDGDLLSSSGSRTPLVLCSANRNCSIFSMQEDGRRYKLGRTLWSRTIYESSPSSHRITAILPSDLDHILIGTGSSSFLIPMQVVSSSPDHASLQVTSTHELMNSGMKHVEHSARSDKFIILSLFEINNARTGQKLLVGGGDDGSVSIWNPRYVCSLMESLSLTHIFTSTLKLQARWVVFLEPLVDVILLEDEKAGRLQNCCMCISADGTIAVIAVDNLTL